MNTINTISIFKNETAIYTAGAIDSFTLIAKFKESEFEAGFNKMKENKSVEISHSIKKHFNYKKIESGKWYILNKAVKLTEEEIQTEVEKELKNWINSLTIIRTLEIIS